jgi:hypothetical protein
VLPGLLGGAIVAERRAGEGEDQSGQEAGHSSCRTGP